jgi:transcriptional regulator of NAD metabolism
MKAAERQKKIIELLTASKTPICGDAFSETFDVSRQIIVHDVSVLREQGYQIIPTHRGYILGDTPLFEKEIKLHHESGKTVDELLTIVGLGGSVIDVFVEHDIYGKLSAPLNIFSAADVNAFKNKAKKGGSAELMSLTSGYHYHTVRAETEEVMNEIEKALDKKGYLVK